MNFKMGKATMTTVVYEVCRAIVDELYAESLPPMTTYLLRVAEAGFRTKWRYPFCCGALDGKHFYIRVRIVSFIYLQCTNIS